MKILAKTQWWTTELLNTPKVVRSIPEKEHKGDGGIKNKPAVFNPAVYVLLAFYFTNTQKGFCDATKSKDASPWFALPCAFLPSL